MALTRLMGVVVAFTGKMAVAEFCPHFPAGDLTVFGRQHSVGVRPTKMLADRFPVVCDERNFHLCLHQKNDSNEFYMPKPLFINTVNYFSNKCHFFWVIIHYY
jgi:hypothetical protein